MGILADVRYAFRAFRLAPGFHAILIAMLALGIGISAAVFSIVDGVLLRPLPYRDPSRLVALTAVAADSKFDSNGSLPYFDFEQLKARTRSFEDLAITYRTGWSLITLTGAEPQRVQGAFVSPNLFALFGRAPVVGRTFTTDEDRRGDRLVVLSEPFAVVRYGSAGAAIGRDLEIGGVPWRVIGVMPADFRVPFLATRVWMPIHAHPEWNAREEVNPLLRQRWDVIGRLKPGIGLSAAQSEVDAIEAQLRSALPDYHNDFRISVEPLREYFTGGVSRQLWTLFAAVAFLLLIACVNAGNLLLSRAASRQREFAVRAALGGVRVRFVRQLLSESVTYSLAAGALGIVLAAALVPILKAVAPGGIPRFEGVGLDARVVVFALAVSLLTGILLGAAPALYASKRDIGDLLNGAGRTVGADRRSGRAKRFLIAAEFAAAMVLLTTAGLLIRSFIAVQAIDPGFRPEHVLSIRVDLPNSTPAAQATLFYDQTMEHMSTLPGVTAVGGISNLFFLDEKRTHALRQVEGRPAEPRSAWKPLVWTQVAGDYFQAMGIRLLRGRYFDRGDRPGSPLVAIVNESLAQRYWPGADPIGKRFKGFDPRGRNDDWLTIVGVVQDSRSGGLERQPFAQIYELQSQRGDQLGSLVVRTAGDPVQLAAAARSIIRGLNPAAIVPAITTMEQLLEEQEAGRRFQTWLLTVFSALALALSAFGVFAVMHYAVSARTHEIAIRMALGARVVDVLVLITGEGGRLALTGIGIGAVVSGYLSTAIASMLYGVAPLDMVSFSAAAALLAAVAVAACYYPARRASSVDPMTALRQ